jgi:hypothetical protein
MGFNSPRKKVTGISGSGTDQLQKFRFAPDGMPFPKLFSNCQAVAYVQFGVTVPIEAVDSKNATETEAEQFGSSHLTPRRILRIILGVSKIF